MVASQDRLRQRMNNGISPISRGSLRRTSGARELPTSPQIIEDRRVPLSRAEFRVGSFGPRRARWTCNCIKVGGQRDSIANISDCTDIRYRNEECEIPQFQHIGAPAPRLRSQNCPRSRPWAEPETAGQANVYLEQRRRDHTSAALRQREFGAGATIKGPAIIGQMD